MDLKVGNVFYNKNEGLLDARKCHIVNIFEDDDEDIIVFKFYGKHKQYWHYRVMPDDDFESNFDAGLFYEKKKAK